MSRSTVIKCLGIRIPVVLMLFSFSVSAQEKYNFNFDSYGFFDNLEYHSDYRRSETMAGMWYVPEFCIAWDDNHSLHAGVGFMTHWGDQEKAWRTHAPVLYYEYCSDQVKFDFGSFGRDKLRGEFGTAFFSDSVRYFDPTMQGVLLQYGADRRYVELFIDWITLRTESTREQFLAGSSVFFNFGQIFYTGFEGYYNHYALRWNPPADEHIRDYAVAHLFAGCDLSGVTPLDRLDFRAGLLTDFERCRDSVGKWYINPGMLLQSELSFRRFNLSEDFYLGRGMQSSADAGRGKWYMADAFYRSGCYSRTELNYSFIKSRYVNSSIGCLLHVDDSGRLSWNQRLLLTISL